jgi:hypothetical protein
MASVKQADDGKYNTTGWRRERDIRDMSLDTCPVRPGLPPFFAAGQSGTLSQMSRCVRPDKECVK